MLNTSLQGQWAHSRTQPSEGCRAVWRGSRASHNNSAWPKSQSPGLSLNLLFSVQAFWVWELGHTLPDGNLRATSIQTIQIGPGLLRNLPIVSPCGIGEAHLHRGHIVSSPQGRPLLGTLGIRMGTVPRGDGQQTQALPKSCCTQKCPSSKSPQGHVSGCCLLFPRAWRTCREAKYLKSYPYMASGPGLG